MVRASLGCGASATATDAARGPRYAAANCGLRKAGAEPIGQTESGHRIHVGGVGCDGSCKVAGDGDGVRFARNTRDPAVPDRDLIGPVLLRRPGEIERSSPGCGRKVEELAQS